ncbi:MAG: ABC transporter ATP-binding protein [Rhizobiaceae bacterium]|nr:ABC transporter ATP-binding protein [Rhizobiaceae bacterium]
MTEPLNTMPENEQPVLNISGLSTVYNLKIGQVKSVTDVSFELARGEILGLVGESGSGKSVTGLSIAGLITAPGRVVSGSVLLHGQELTTLSENALRAIRGNDISIIFQDPMTTLNPVLTIGQQFFEVIHAHRKCSYSQAMKEAETALIEVGIPAPRERLDNYPHELSGGMRQRVCIAISLINKPSVVIADEPTTALDVTIQSQILHMMQRLVRERDVAMIWVTHDLSVVAGFCDKLAVMYAGRIVEAGPVQQVLSNPAHPYTAGLMDSIPGDCLPGSRLEQIPGTQPSPLQLPSGCAFRTRCKYARNECAEKPPEVAVGSGRTAQCFFPLTEVQNVRRK